MTQVKKWALRGLGCGVVFAVCFLLGQVATNSAFSQLPATSPGGTLNFISNGIGLLFNQDSAGTRKLFGPIFPLSAPPTSGWSNDNCGTFDTTYGYPYFLSPKTTGSQQCVEYRTAPGTPYIIRALIYHDLTSWGGAAPSNNQIAYGILFRDSTGKELALEVVQSSTTAPYMASQKWTNATTASTTYKATTAGNAQNGYDGVFRNPLWLAIQDDGTNLNLFWSLDGQHLRQFDTELRTDFMISGPTQVGIFVRSQGSDTIIAVPSWGP